MPRPSGREGIRTPEAVGCEAGSPAREGGNPPPLGGGGSQAGALSLAALLGTDVCRTKTATARPTNVMSAAVCSGVTCQPNVTASDTSAWTRPKIAALMLPPLSAHLVVNATHTPATAKTTALTTATCSSDHGNQNAAASCTPDATRLAHSAGSPVSSCLFKGGSFLGDHPPPGVAGHSQKKAAYSAALPVLWCTSASACRPHATHRENPCGVYGCGWLRASRAEPTPSLRRACTPTSCQRGAIALPS